MIKDLPGHRPQQPHNPRWVMVLSEGSHQPCSVHPAGTGSGSISEEARGAPWSLHLAPVHPEQAVRRSPGKVKRGGVWKMAGWWGRWDRVIRRK